MGLMPRTPRTRRQLVLDALRASFLAVVGIVVNGVSTCPKRIQASGSADKLRYLRWKVAGEGRTVLTFRITSRRSA